MKHSSYRTFPLAIQHSRPPTVAAQPIHRPVSLLYLLAVWAYAVLFCFWQYESVPIKAHLAGVLVFATCSIPMARWYAQGSQTPPMFELICLSYAVHFSLPLYMQPNALPVHGRVVQLSWDRLFTTLLSVELGMIALIAGYYVFRRSPLAQDLPKVDLPLTSERRNSYLVAVFLFHGILQFYQAFGWSPWGVLPGSRAFMLVANNQLTLFIILLTYLVCRPETRGLVPVVAWYAAVSFVFVRGLTSGKLSNAFHPLAMVAIARWHATKKTPWRWILAGLILFVILQATKSDFRRQLWVENRYVRRGQQVWVWLDLIQENIVESASLRSWDGFEAQLRQSLNRVNLLHKFAYVRQVTPAVVPYYRGETYSYFLHFWIPRLYWQDKPVASAATSRTDRDYGLVSEAARATSIGIGQLAEAYANFGTAGIPLVMALQGIIFGLIDSVFNSERSDGGRAIYLSLMVPFLNSIGTSLVMAFGALAQHLLANALVLRLFATGWQANTEPKEIPATGQPNREHYTFCSRSKPGDISQPREARR